MNQRILLSAITIICTIIFSVPEITFADWFPEPLIEGNEKLVYSMRSSKEKKGASQSMSYLLTKGETPKKVVFETSRTTKGGKDILKIIAKSTLINKNTAVDEIIYERKDGKLRLLSNVRTIKGPRGIIRKQINDFTAPSLKIPPETIYAMSLPILLRGIPMKKGYKGSLILWVMEGNVFKFKVENLGLEDIKTKSGTHKCYKVRMTIDLSSVISNKMLAKLVQPFIPGFDFMLNEKSPHELIYFKGLMAGIGTPPMIMEKE